MTTATRLLEELEQRGPLKDSELAAILKVAHQQVNQTARRLVARGAITRLRAVDGVLRNHLVERSPATGETRVPFDHPASTSAPRASVAPMAALGPRAPGTPTSRAELTQLGFLKHDLQKLGPSDALSIGDGLDWNTLGPVPTGTGLYCFVAEGLPDASPRVMYVGLSTELSGIAAGIDSNGGARGGQRYGRPRHAGMTRKRINAEVSRLIQDGQTVTHWFAVLRVPDREEPRAFLRREEEDLIVRWKLRSRGWNRG